MPNLYGITSNANVSVGNTTGLYQQSGNVAILNSAGTLLSLLSNTGTVGFALTNAGNQVLASVNPDAQISLNSIYWPDVGGSTVANGNFGSLTTQVGGSEIVMTTNSVSINGGQAVDLSVGYGSLNFDGTNYNINITSGTFPSITEYTWNFTNDGNLTLPTNNSRINYANGVSILTGLSGSGSTYSNANVAAYLAAGSDPTILSINANITAANVAIVSLQSNAAVQETEISGLRANITAANAAIVTVQNNLTTFETYANAAYATQSNVGTIYTHLNTLDANVGAYEIANNANVGTIYTHLNTLDANVGAYETYANATFLTSSTGYGNANVAAYLPKYTGNISAGNISVTGVTVSGNIQANYISVLGGAISSNSTVGAISVGNLSLADSGVLASFQNNTNSYTYVAVQNTNSGAVATADYTAYNDQSSYMDMGINSSGYSGTGNFSLPGAGYIYTGNTDLSIGTYGNNNIHFINNNGATDSVTIFANGNVAGTNFLGSSRYFSGNLAGNVLYNGATGASGYAANIQAFNGVGINPIASNSWSIFQTTNTSGTLNPNVAQYSNYGGVQTITTAGPTSSITQTNVTYSTKSGTIQSLNGAALFGQYFLANTTMNANDRIRHVPIVGEVFMTGQTYGAWAPSTGNIYPTTFNAATNLTAATVQSVYSGFGNVSSESALLVSSQVAPSSSGPLNINYETGVQVTLGYSAWTTGAQPSSYIDIARAYYPTAQFGNTTAGVQNISNLYGLHIINHWENGGTAGRSVLGNKRAIQIEDATTDIFTLGNIIVGGNIYTSVGNILNINATTNTITTTAQVTINSNLTVAGSNSLLKVSTYTATALNAITGSVGQVAAVSNGTAKNGGQLAYWDTTNSRWSWFDTNLAVS